jgi:hypothetical protein
MHRQMRSEVFMALTIRKCCGLLDPTYWQVVTDVSAESTITFSETLPTIFPDGTI